MDTSALSEDIVLQALEHVLTLGEDGQDVLLEHLTHRQRPIFEYIMEPCLEAGETTSRRGLFLLMVVLEAFHSRFPDLGQVKLGQLRREEKQAVRQFAGLKRDNGTAFSQYLREPGLTGTVSEYLTHPDGAEELDRDYSLLFPLFTVVIQALHHQAHHPAAPWVPMTRKRRPRR